MTHTPPPDRRLNSWKEIAAFLGRGERTVKRWEIERGLPIHRVPGKTGARIYAHSAELTAWLRSAPAEPPLAEPTQTPSELPPAPSPASRISGWRLAATAAAGVAALTAAGIWWGVQTRPAPVKAQHNPEAVELYREGLHDWNARTGEGLQKAVDEFTQAIVRDPSYAEAYVGLANAYNLLREYTAMPDSEAYPRAEAAATRAIALDPSLAEAHSALGFVQYYWRWNAATSEKEFRTALGLDPKDHLIHHWYANVLKNQRRFAESLEQINIAQALEPDSSAVLADKGALLLNMGQVEEGRQILNRMVQVDPGFGSPHAYLADWDLSTKDYVDFLVEARRLSVTRADPISLRVVDAAQRGWTQGGGDGLLSAMLAEQRALYDRHKVSAYQVARTYAVMGRPQECRTWLALAVKQHDPTVLGATIDPLLATVWRRPEFAFIRNPASGNT